MTPPSDNSLHIEDYKSLSFSLTEYPDTKYIDKIYKLPELHEPQRKQYKLYIDSVDDGSVDIEYIKYKKYGRYYVKNSNMISACPMWREVRATLFKNKDVDIDLVCCHIKALYNKVKKFGNFDNIYNYTLDKEFVFKSFIIDINGLNEYNKINKDRKTKKDILKDLITRILYYGSFQKWAEDYYQYDCVPSDEFILIEKEIKKACSIVFAVGFCDKLLIDDIINEEKKEAIKKHLKDEEIRCEKDKRCKPKPFDERTFVYEKKSILSLYLQELECGIIMNVKKFLKYRFSIEFSVYCYDGFQISIKDFNKHNNLIDEINNYIKDDDMKFIVKPFTDGFNDDDFNKIILPEKWSEAEYEYLLNNFQKKKYVEKYYYKIHSMNGLCYYDNNDKIAKVKDNSLHFGWIYKDYIYDYLYNTKNITTYASFDLYPNNKKCPNDVLNIWKGFKIEKYNYKDGESYDELLIEPILNHIKLMAKDDYEDYNTKLYNYLLNYFAWLIQKPEQKINVCLLIQGKQGTGKTTIAEMLMGGIMGSRYLAQTCEIDKICGKFNSLLANKLLCILNEATGKDTKDIMDKIKDSITREEINIEYKGIDVIPQIDYCNFIYTTNNFNPVKLDEDDRRFQVIKMPSTYKNNYQYFKTLRDCLSNELCLKIMYDYLMKRDLKNFDPINDRVKTQATLDIYEANIDYIEEFLSYLFYSYNETDDEKYGNKKDKYGGQELFNLFKNKMSEWNTHNYYNIKSFSIKLKELIKDKFCDVIKIKRIHNRVVYHFDWCLIKED